MAGCDGNTQPTKITKLIPTENPLANHEINIVSGKINEFIAASFKASTNQDLDASVIQRLGKPLGIVLTWQQILDPKYLSSWEFLSSSKETLLKLMYMTINRSNNNVQVDQTKVNKPFH